MPNYPVHGPAEILNPIEDYTYNVLAAIYADITNTFPGSYVHLGLDEAYYACWLVGTFNIILIASAYQITT